MESPDRRNFIKRTAIAGIGISLAGNALGWVKNAEKGKRIGMIGLDTGHSTAFTKSLNDPNAGETYRGYKVVAAVPEGTDNILEWKNRIPEFTKEVQSQGVEIVHSIDEMLEKVDVVILS